MDAERLQYAVRASACGDYVMAERILGDRDDMSSLALSLLGSGRRQVGALAEARTLDEAALRSARDAESRADALIGLAADAVAAGDEPSAAAAHAEADADARDWRTRTRWHWVGAELALLRGEGDIAAQHATEAVGACAGRSTRHEAKSAIVLAAAAGDTASLPATLPVLRAHGWNTLIWPLALVAADHSGGLDTAWCAEAWAEGYRATVRIEDCLPAHLVATWRRQDGVRRLRATGGLVGGE